MLAIEHEKLWSQFNASFYAVPLGTETKFFQGENTA